MSHLITGVTWRYREREKDAPNFEVPSILSHLITGVAWRYREREKDAPNFEVPRVEVLTRLDRVGPAFFLRAQKMFRSELDPNFFIRGSNRAESDLMNMILGSNQNLILDYRNRKLGSSPDLKNT